MSFLSYKVVVDNKLTGTRHSAVRKSCGIHQKTLAERMKVSHKIVSLLETGRKEWNDSISISYITSLFEIKLSEKLDSMCADFEESLVKKLTKDLQKI